MTWMLFFVPSLPTTPTTQILELCERERFMKEPSLLGIFVASKIQCTSAEEEPHDVFFRQLRHILFCFGQQVNPEGNWSH